MDPVPPLDVPSLIGACVPAVLAATFAAASWALSMLSGARRTALRDTLTGGPQRALDRYLESRTVIESRWLVIRALGIGTTAILMMRALPLTDEPARSLVSLLAAVLSYALPSEIGRSLAALNPEKAAPWLLRVLRPIELLAAPLAAPVLWLARLVGGLAAHTPSRSRGVTETEVELIVNEGELNGSLGHEESEMIRNVLEFGDVTAGQVMLPRTQVRALSVDLPLEEALRQVADGGHSRYPVYRSSIDNMVGLVYAKDLLRAVADGDPKDRTLEALVRSPVAFVPESQLASSVLKDMRAGRHHMALVIDEFGGVSGVVTLEDVLEEIVGDIRDEHDENEPPIVDLGEGRLMADASIPIADLGRYLGTELPEDDGYNSLGGFVVAQLGRVPKVGEELVTRGFGFVVREADQRHVSKVEIRRLSPPESIVPRAPSSRVSAA